MGRGQMGNPLPFVLVVVTLTILLFSSSWALPDTTSAEFEDPADAEAADEFEAAFEAFIEGTVKVLTGLVVSVVLGGSIQDVAKSRLAESLGLDGP